MVSVTVTVRISSFVFLKRRVSVGSMLEYSRLWPTMQKGRAGCEGQAKPVPEPGPALQPRPGPEHRITSSQHQGRPRLQSKRSVVAYFYSPEPSTQPWWKSPALSIALEEACCGRP